MVTRSLVSKVGRSVARKVAGSAGAGTGDVSTDWGPRETFLQPIGTTALGPDLSWTNVTGTSSVQDEAAESVSATGIIQPSDTIPADNVTAWGKVVSQVATTNVGIGVRADASDNGIYFFVKNNGSTTYRLFSRNTGSFNQQIGSTVAATLPTPPYTMRVSVEGTTVTGYINGTAVVSGTFAAQNQHSSNTKAAIYLNGANAPVEEFFAGSSEDAFCTCDYSSFQHTTSANISMAFSGYWLGDDADAVQVRVRAVSGGATVVDWTDVDATLTGDTWSGNLTVPKGGPYYADVRVVNSSDEMLYQEIRAKNFRGEDVFGVGLVVGAIGQSNMSGRGDSAQSTSGTGLVINRNRTIASNVNDPVFDDTTDGSWLPLLATLVTASQSCPLMIVGDAVGSTTLTSGSAEWLPPSGDRYAAWADLVSKWQPTIGAVLWLQGESEINLGESEADYETGEQTLATAVNALTGSPELLALQLGEYAAFSDAEVDAIRYAKQDNWDAGHTVFGGNWHDLSLTDGLHAASDTQLGIIAGRVWLALEDELLGGSNGRGPRVSSVTGAGTSTLTVTFDSNLDTNDSTYTTALFEFDNDDGTARSVTAVSRASATTVEVTLDGAADGTSPTLTFASGNTTAGATMPKSAPISLPATINSVSEVALPAEPFRDEAVTSVSTESDYAVLFGIGAIEMPAKDITDYNSDADETTFQAAVDDTTESVFRIPAGTYTLSDSVDVDRANITFVCDPGVQINIAASGYSDTREVDLNSKDRNSAFYVTANGFQFLGRYGDTTFDMQADVYDGSSKYMNAFLLHGAEYCVIGNVIVDETHNGVMLYKDTSSGTVFANGNRVFGIACENPGSDANFKNAALDVYGQDGLVFSDLYVDNYEECVDFNGDSKNIRGSDIYGLNCEQYVVEIQNSVNVSITNYQGEFTDTQGGLILIQDYSGPTLTNENISATNGVYRCNGIQQQTPAVWVEDCKGGQVQVLARLSDASSNGEFLIIGNTSNDVSTVEGVDIDLDYWITHNKQVKSVCGWRSGNANLKLNFRGTPTANFGIIDLKTANVGRINAELTGVSVDASGNENQVASSIGIDVDSTATNAIGSLTVNMDVATEINDGTSGGSGLWAPTTAAI